MATAKGADSEVFPNAPLVEAVFEIKFNGALSVDCNKHKIQHHFRKRFPLLGVPSLPSAGPHPLAAPLRLSNTNDTELVQFSVTNFSYHLKKYTRFAEFKRKGIAACQSFMRLAELEAFERVGLRYVDRIPVLRQGGLIPLNRYLNFRFQLPEAIPEKLEQFSVRLITKLGPGELRTNLILQQSSDANKNEWIVLDFDFITFGHMKLNDLGRCLDAAHKHTKSVFMSLISKEYLQVMRQQGEA